jgi:hypothetical protein
LTLSLMIPTLKKKKILPLKKKNNCYQCEFTILLLHEFTFQETRARAPLLSGGIHKLGKKDSLSQSLVI